MRETVPDADLGQQPLDERKVAFAVLHDLLAPGVFAHQLEQEVLTEEIVAAAQDVLDDLRHRLLLVQAVLTATIEQGKARLQGDFIARFVAGGGQALEAIDHPIQAAQRLDLGHWQARVRRLCRRRIEAKTGVLVEHLLGAEVLLAAGEFDAVGEGLAEVFFAFEGEDIERGVEPADREFVTGVVEEDARLCAHVRPSWSVGETHRKGLAFTRVLRGESFGEMEGSWK